MKKIFALFIICALVFSLAACGKAEEEMRTENNETATAAPDMQTASGDETVAETATVNPAGETASGGETARAEETADKPDETETTETPYTPTTKQEKPAGADTDGFDDWGLKMTFDCTDGEKGTVTFIQSTAAGKPEGELMTGASYKVEAKDEGRWISYEGYVRKHYDPDYKDPNLTFIMLAYLIPLDSEYTMDVDFTNTYGKLYPGTYRLVKEVSESADSRRTARNYYGEFIVK